MRMAIDLVGSDCPPLRVHSSPDSSRLFSMFTMADSSVAVSAQRRGRRSDHLKKCLICNESTELAQWPSDTTRQLFRPGSIPANAGKISPNFLPLPLLICASPLSSTHHIQHLPKLHPSLSLFFAHSTLCGHFENSISFLLCII